jgi:Amidohydrolase family
VTTAPAAVAGLSHRLGTLRPGMDADVVLWDSHPLRLGATPVAVWVDGIAQPLGREIDVFVGKGKEAPEWREPPKVPDWKREREESLKWDGLPPLGVEQVSETVIFANVSAVLVRGTEGIEHMFHPSAVDRAKGVVIVHGGKIICAGVDDACNSLIPNRARLVDLEGGVLAPAFISFGSNLGLQEIAHEPSTGDGLLYDAFTGDVPEVLRDPGGIVQAADALEFQTRNALYDFSLLLSCSFLTLTDRREQHRLSCRCYCCHLTAARFLYRTDIFRTFYDVPHRCTPPPRRRGSHSARFGATLCHTASQCAHDTEWTCSNTEHQHTYFGFTASITLGRRWKYWGYCEVVRGSGKWRLTLGN